MCARKISEGRKPIDNRKAGYAIGKEIDSKSYNTMGGRIAKKRIEKGWSQDVLAKKLHKERNTIIRWENNHAKPSVEDIEQLKNLFGCESGYFFCEFEESFMDIHKIHEFTGLSEKAIDCIRFYNLIDSQNRELLNGADELLINQLLTSGHFRSFITELFGAIDMLSPLKFWNEKEENAITGEFIQLVDSHLQKKEKEEFLSEEEKYYRGLSMLAAQSVKAVLLSREGAYDHHVQIAKNHINRAIDEIMEKEHESPKK